MPRQTPISPDPTQQNRRDQFTAYASADLSHTQLVHKLQQFIDSDPEFIELRKFYETNNTADMQELFDDTNGKGSWELYLATARNHAALEDIRLAPDTWVMLTAGIRALKAYIKNPEKTKENNIQQQIYAKEIAAQQKLAIILTKRAIIINRHLQQAKEFYKHHNYLQAIYEASKVIGLKPDCVEGYLIRGDCYYDSDKLQEADNDYTQAINLGCNHPGIYLKRGAMRYQLGNFSGSSNKQTCSLFC